MAINYNAVVKQSDQQKAQQISRTMFTKANDLAALGLKHVAIDGYNINFYKDAEPAEGAAPDFVVDLPGEMFLNQTETQFYGDNGGFNWEAWYDEVVGQDENEEDITRGARAGLTRDGNRSENPGLDGKPVFVLCVKGEDTDANGTAVETYNYSFLNMEALITGVSDDKADKVRVDANGNVYGSEETGEAFNVDGHMAILDATGNPADSGIVAANVLTTANLTGYTSPEEAAEEIDHTYDTDNMLIETWGLQAYYDAFGRNQTIAVIGQDAYTAAVNGGTLVEA